MKKEMIDVTIDDLENWKMIAKARLEMAANWIW